MKEAAARIKINRLLENAGWRFFADANGPANIQLEPGVTVKTQDLDAIGEDFEKAGKSIPALKTYFKAYATSDQIRHIIESGQLTDLATNPVFSTKDFKAVPQKYRTLIPEYIKDYVSLNQFAA